MAERYERLYALEHRLHAPDAPVLIAGGSLLRDGYTGNLLCQLKLLNIGEKPIKALSAAIAMLDTTGAPLGKELRHQYLDLQAGRDDSFGEKTAIVLPRKDARAFRARVTEVIFQDNSRWQRPDEEDWSALRDQRTLEEEYGDRELANQFRIRYGPDCTHAALEDGELWYCTCAAVNRADENSCHRCHRVRSALLDVNPVSLRAECAERLKSEQVRQEEDRHEARQRNKKRLKWAAVAIPVLFVVVSLAFTVPKLVQRQQVYNAAVTLLNKQRFEDAAQVFHSLDGYRDSAEQAEKNVPYSRALYFMDRAKAGDASALRSAGHSRSELSEDVTVELLLYQAAMEQFEALGDYKESRENIRRCQEAIEAAQQARLQAAYDQAAELLDSESYSLARQAFLELGDFGDSADMAREAVYRKAQALFHFLEGYDTRGVYASVSLDPARGSSFSVSKEKALTLGSQFIRDLRGACGTDDADVNLTDTPAENLPSFADCVRELFRSLDGYRDSEQYLTDIDTLTDYTRDFFMLCEAGDLYGAYDWLQAYEGEFADRELWRSRLDRYKPYCAAWTLYLGDATLLPMTIGRSQPCYDFTSRVILSGDRATLRLTANDGEEYYVDLQADMDSVSFLKADDGVSNYLASITTVDHLAYMRYDQGGNLRSSCEYQRAT